MRNHRAIQRSRTIHSGLELIRSAMLYVLAGGTFRALAACRAEHGPCMTDTAWRLRFLGMKDALSAIVGQMLCDRAGLRQGSKMDAMVVDGTDVSGPRGKHIQRMHTAMDLKTHRLVQLKLTDHHTAESMTQFPLAQTKLAMADAGYARSKQLIAAMKETRILVRFTPSRLKLYDVHGRQIDLLPVIRESPRPIDLPCFLEKGQCHPVRVVAIPIPPEQHGKMARRKERHAKSNGHKLRASTIEYGKWLFLVTTLDAEYDVGALKELYRLRWQIEILFKNMKQSLPFHLIRRCGEEMSQVLMYVLAILWLLSETYREMVDKTFSGYLERRIAEKTLARSFFDQLLAQLRLGASTLRFCLHLKPFTLLMDHKSARSSP